MKLLRRIYRLPVLFLWGVWYALYSIPIRYFYGTEHGIRRMAIQTKSWGAGIIRILGFRMILHGSTAEYEKTGGLVVANHQSFTDICLHAAVFGLRFTPKAEIQSWPVLGWFIGLARPIWIDRKSKQSSVSLMEQFRETLREKVPLIIYPEGTTSDGRSGLLPFKTAPFETVCGTNIPIQPIISIYHPAPGDVHPAWYGDMTFLPHLWAILGNKRSTVDVYILPPIYPEGRSRKQLAECVREAMLEVYNEHADSTIEPPKEGDLYAHEHKPQPEQAS